LRTPALQETGKHTLNECAQIGFKEAETITLYKTGKFKNNEISFLQYDLDNYLVADKSLARPTSRCILFDGENISFAACLVIYINSTNIPTIMIINRIYEHQNLLSL
jgi:hypothetical protein